MKILHVLTSARAEGTPRLVLDWLTVSGYNQEVLFLSNAGELKEDFAKTGTWYYFNKEFTLRFTSAFKIIMLVKRICRERQPDVVISWPMGFSQWIHLGARLAGVRKLIVHAGNPPGKSFVSKYIFTYLSFWIGYYVGNKVIACSQYIRDEFLAIPLLSKTQFYWVHNCIQVTKFTSSLKVARNSNQGIIVATLERHKDHETLLLAWDLLEKKGCNYHLFIVGDGSLNQPLRKLKSSLSLKFVEFAGTRKDVPYLLQQSSVFILSTTEQEGFGTVLVEAMASGCKIIATDVKACREVLQNGLYGKLVNVGDPTQLAMAIQDSFQHEISDDELGAQINYASGFTPERMIIQYLNIAAL